VAAAAHAGHRIRHQRFVLATLLDGERDEILLPFIALEIDGDARQQKSVLPGGVLEGCHVENVNAGDRLFLVAEPTPRGDETRRHGLLEGVLLAARKKRIEGASQD
jgi:hypothetical protein